MTKNEFLNIFNDIDDEFLNELAAVQLRKKRVHEKKLPRKEVVWRPQHFRPDSSSKSGATFKKAMIAVAAVACVVAVGIFIRMNNKPQTVSPNSSIAVSSGDNIESNSTPSFADGIVNKKLDNVTFDFKINSDHPTELPKIKLKEKQFDAEILKSTLLSGKTITDRNERNLMGGGKQITYNTSDKCVLQVSPGNFSLRDGGIGDTSKNFGTVANYFDDYCNSNNVELTSFPRTDAIQRVNSVLNEVGVENYGEPYVIPVSSEMANSYFEMNEGANKKYTFWTQDEGLYVLKYKFNFGGIDISNACLKGVDSGRTLVGSDITAYVTKDNIFYLDVRQMYEGEFADAGAVELKFSAEDAANELIEYYSKQYVEDPKRFTECKLEYVPFKQASDSEVIFTPAWRFSGYEFKRVSDIPTDCVEYYYVDTGMRYAAVIYF